jgi:anaerobic magnesium-protoporphyrin IX monomethyl ester cyclase
MNLLINPSSMIQCGYTPPPLGLLFLAAMNDDTRIIDMAMFPNFEIESHLANVRPNVVGVPIYSAGRSEGFRLLKLAKEAGCITVAGGPHVPLMFTMDWEPTAEYPYIDHFVFGDGEQSWLEITQRPHSGPKLWKQDMKNPCDLNALPLPAYDRIPHARYPARASFVTEWKGVDLTATPRYSIVFGRGCTGTCNFCSTWWVHGKYHHHSIEWMRRHFDQLSGLGARHLVFQDDCLTVDRKEFLDLCRIMEAYQFVCIGTTRVDYVDDEIAAAAFRAGFYEISFGIEHGSQLVLDKMHKNTNLGAAFKAREACAKAGIKFTALMIDGYPGETREDQQKSRDLLAKLKPDLFSSLGFTMVFPGTRLYSQCKKSGLVEDSFWLGDEPFFIYPQAPA